jgi:hypothetical protein
MGSGQASFASERIGIVRSIRHAEGNVVDGVEYGYSLAWWFVFGYLLTRLPAQRIVIAPTKRMRVMRKGIQLRLVLLAVLAFSFGFSGEALSQSVDALVISAWNDMQAKHEPRYISIEYDAARDALALEKTFSSTTSYEEFRATFREEEVRFYLVEISYPIDEEKSRSCRALYLWTGARAKVMAKAKASIQAATLRGAIKGYDTELAGSEQDAFAQDDVIRSCREASRAGAQ